MERTSSIACKIWWGTANALRQKTKKFSYAGLEIFRIRFWGFLATGSTVAPIIVKLGGAEDQVSVRRAKYHVDRATFGDF